MIIGGHSHTILEQPAKVNNVLIAQAGVGTNQIGRFDIVVDDDTNSIIDYKWPIAADLCHLYWAENGNVDCSYFFPC